VTAVKSRTPRLYLERDLSGVAVSLDDREAHYLGNVLRLRRGDRLVTFNGRGQERHASVRALTRRNAELALEGELGALPEPALAITLVQALPKAEAMDLIVQKCTELGVRSIVPVYSDFSVVKLDAERSARRLQHWRRIARSACEQCGRHTPPEITAPEALAAFLGGRREAGARLVLEPRSELRLTDVLPAPAAVTLLVGPEGGFSPGDLERITAADFTPATLGPRVLRAETAAIAACAAAQLLWGD